MGPIISAREIMGTVMAHAAHHYFHGDKNWGVRACLSLLLLCYPTLRCFVLSESDPGYVVLHYVSIVYWCGW